MKNLIKKIAAIIFALSMMVSGVKDTLALSLDTVFEVVPGLQPLGLLDGDLFGVELKDIFGDGQSDSETIKKAYQKCLGREPKAEEVKYHEDLITQKTARGFKTGGAGVEEIVAGICNSEEAKNKSEDGAEDTSTSNQFLWKPVSESDGKLVILLPNSMKGQVVSVSVQSGQTQETGRFSGDTHNGNRPHFRFTKPGSGYGSNIMVVAAGTSGMCSWTIPNGAQRFEAGEGNCGAGAGMGAGFGGAGYAGGFVYDPGNDGLDVDEYLSSLLGGAGKNACFDRGQTDGNEVIMASGKCFSTVTNKPFFPVADTAWNIYKLSANDLESYIKTRKSQGFNVIKFVGTGFGGTFAQYDLVFNKLAENKMYAEVMLDSSMYDQSVAFVNRYKNRSNLFMWVVWGIDKRRTEAETVALMRGVKANDSTHLVTAHPKGGSSTSALSGVNSLSPIYYVHSYAVGKAESLIKTDVSKNNKPVYQGEPAYDGSRNSASNVKSEVEKSFNAGAAGISYGHDNIWQGCSAAGQKTTVTGVTYTCNNSVLNSLDTPATAWIKSTFTAKAAVTTKATTATTTKTTNSALTNDLVISCEISDTSIEVDEETEISVDISGGESPYKIRWSGDTSRIRKISKTKNDQDIEFKKSGKYVLEVKVTDDAGKEIEEICSAINVYEKDAEQEEEAVNSTDYTTPTYAAPTASFYRDLTIGSEGSDVVALQDYLISRGFLAMPAGVVKGYFGELTRSAVARWQASVGLTPAAGYFGQKSRTYISTGVIPVSTATAQTYVAPTQTAATPKPAVSAASCVNVTKTLTYEQSNSDVSKVQDFLEMKGFLVMPEGATKGTYGKLTATAIANYMATKNISTSGRIADESVLSQIRKDTGCAY